MNGHACVCRNMGSDGPLADEQGPDAERRQFWGQERGSLLRSSLCFPALPFVFQAPREGRQE